MGFIDTAAAAQLKEMMDEHGLTAESLALRLKLTADIAIRSGDAPWAGYRGTVDATTIRRIIDEGHVPGPRVRGVLANYFNLAPRELWRPSLRLRTSRETGARAA